MNVRKIATLLLIAMFACATLIAQQFHTEKSEVFDEPVSGWNEVQLLKNGNTFLYHAGDKDGINITVYDKNRKIVSQKNITSKLWDISDVASEFVFEINGAPALFLSLNGREERTLVRLRLNPSTGEVINEEVIATASTLGKVKLTFVPFDVIKDPASDCYAVISKNLRKGRNNEDLMVSHFDGSHNKISEASYKAPLEKFEFYFYSSAFVDGNKHVYLVLSGFAERPRYNTSDLKANGDCKAIVAKLNTGEKTFTNTVLDINVDFGQELTTQMLALKNGNYLQLLIKAVTETKKKMNGSLEIKYYTSLIAYLAPESLQILGVAPIGGAKVNEYGQAHIGDKYEFTGVPESMVINKDNTTSVLMEKGESMQGKSYLKDIGVSVFSDSGAEIAGYAIRKSQQETRGVDNDQFMSYDYISTPRGNYVLFNDKISNIGKEEDNSRRHRTLSASFTNSVAYKLDNNKIEQFFFFGEPDGNTSTFSYTSGTSYNDALNTYATLIIEREGKQKHARLAWVTFD